MSSSSSSFSAYSPLHPDLCRQLKPFDLPLEHANLHRSFSFDSQKRYNLHSLDQGVVLFSAGNTVQLYDSVSKRRTVLQGHGKGYFAAIGAIAVHPSKRLFAVGERGQKAAIFLYSYPELEVIRILRDGSELGFQSLVFSPSGAKIASVSTEPDYSLTVWDWENERVILRTRAFSAEVTRCEFSPFDEGKLISSGSGHIKFWRMASTFTGLKLQGSIGKFGNIELTDIHAFVELPDGRVLSGSDNGFLLLWDGNFIQFRISQPGRVPCHQGTIEYIALLDGKELLTAGSDGFIKRWSFDKLEFAEAAEEDAVIEVNPMLAIEVSALTAAGGRPVKIRSLTSDEQGNFLIQDYDGGIFRLNPKTHELERLIDSHSGSIAGIAADARFPSLALTGGEDGSLRLWDYESGAQLASRRFVSAVTALRWSPFDTKEIEVFAGFADGAVRIFRVSGSDFKLQGALKPHNSPVLALEISPDHRTLVTAAQDSMFFFEFTSAATVGGQEIALPDSRFLAPIGFSSLSQPPNFVQFHSSSSRLLFSHGLEMIELHRPSVADYPNSLTRETFKISPKSRSFKFHWRREEEEKESKDKENNKWDEKAAISALAYAPEGDKLFASLAPRPFPRPVVAASTEFAHRFERIYEVDMNGAAEPKVALGLGVGPLALAKLVQSSSSSPYLLLGFHSGRIQVRCLNDARFAFSLNYHGSRITSLALSSDGRYLLGASQDGNFFSFQLDYDAALQSVDHSLFDKIEEEKKRKEEEKARNEAEIKEKEEKEREKEKEKEKDKEKDKDGKDKEAEDESGESRMAEDEPAEEEMFDHMAITIAAPGQKRIDPAPLSDTAGKAVQVQTDSALADAADPFSDPHSYSIEEAKQKAEEDERRTQSERKKELMKLELAELRREFNALKRRNAELDRANALESEEFHLEPPIEQFFEADTQAEIAQVQRELQWITEKHAIALKKLRAKFLDPLLVEHIQLKALQSPHTVTSFRVAQFPPAVKAAIEQVHRIIDQEEAEKASAQMKARAEEEKVAGDNSAGDQFAGSQALNARGKKAAKGSSTMSEAEIRRQARAARQAQLASLKANKPERGQDDPADLAAIQWAQKNMGDYKLKSDPNYIVPESQRVNAERKRRQMLLLQESVQLIKMALNERFLALRDLKARLIKNIKRDNERIRQINQKLGHEEELFEPEVNPSEWPEHRELYSAADLDQFRIMKEKEKSRAQANQNRSIWSSALGSFNQQEEDAEEDEAEAALKVIKQKEQQKEAEQMTTQEAAPVQEAAAPPVAASLAPAAEAIHSVADRLDRALLEYERFQLKEKISFAVRSFDSALQKLRLEKFRLDADLKSTDLKILTLYQELHLLEEFEESETRLFNKLSKSRTAKSQLSAEMLECERALQVKLGEIKAWQEKDKAVLNEFNTVVGGEKSEFYPQLMKIFKKKVKRNKKRTGGKGADGGDGGAGDRDSDVESDAGGDSESESESDSGGGSSSSSSEDEDACPLHCDPAIYEKVLELREKRLEQEEILSDFNKSVQELNKTYERHQTRERTIDKELNQTEADIEAFQSEKQRALNLIEVTVPLKLNQLKFLNENKLPKDLTQALIFTSSGLDSLGRRIEELQLEKGNIMRQLKELKKHHKVLLKELSAKRDLIAAEKKKCEDVQLLKFGQTIDLAILDQVGQEDAAQVELDQKLKGIEAQSVRVLGDWDEKIEAAREELTEVTKANTGWLARVADLTSEQHEIESKLNSETRRVHHVTDSKPVEARIAEERRQLLELVQLQEKEIDALKAEMHVLRRKTGQIFV